MSHHGPPRDEQTVLRHREAIAQLYLRGESQLSIALSLGISQQTVSRDLRFLIATWESYASEAISKQKAVEIQRINHLEWTYSDAWERSCRAKRTTSAEIAQEKALEAGTQPEHGDAGPQTQGELAAEVDPFVQRARPDPTPGEPHGQRPPSMSTRTYYLREETRDGNPAFMAGVQWCVEQRLKIMGGYAPGNNQLSGPSRGPIEISGQPPPGTMSVVSLVSLLTDLLPKMSPEERAAALDDYRVMRTAARSFEQRLMALPLANAASSSPVEEDVDDESAETQ